MIYTYIATALVAAGAAALGAWQVQEWRYGAQEAERLEMVAKEQFRRADRIDTASVGHERDKAEIVTEFVEIIREVDRVVEKPVYRDMCLDDDGMRVLSDAINGPDPASKPAGAVPRPSAPD